MAGFIATTPPAETDKMMEAYADKLDEATKMTPEQKQAAMEMLRTQMGNFNALRERGGNIAASLSLTPHV